MKKLIPLALAMTLPVATIAQDSTDEVGTTAETARDRSMIVGFLEDNLSGAGRDIRIEGFKGLLSSTATMEELTIADDEGVWFTLRDAELDWSRTALLSGRVEVTRIAAGEILFDRLPAALPEGDAPSPEATPFALPDLPVSIDIGAIEAERVRLGAPVLKIGQAVELSLSGSAKLADGSGQTHLDITRIDDGAEGAFGVDVSYDNASEVLDLDLSLSESQGGLIATLANLPGAPALDLTAKGSGPLDGFAADITLATQGQERLTGTVALQAEPDPDAPDAPAPRAFTAELSGDLTPLFSAEYARFFGPASQLSARGVSYPAGSFDLERFSLSTQALALVGAARIGTDGLPQSFAVSGSIGSNDGRPTLLPLGSARSYVDQANITASYDAEKDELWTAQIAMEGYAQDGLDIGQAEIDASGTITRNRSENGLSLLGAVTAEIVARVDGLASDDAALQDAIGSAPQVNTSIVWRQGDPVEINDFALRTDATTLTGSATISGFDDGMEINSDLQLQTPRLARFAKLSGQDLSGALTATATLNYVPLNGGFDIEAEATGTDLRFGIEQLDAVTGSDSRVLLSAKRDETGVTLRTARLSTGPLEASAEGTLSSDNGALQLEASLDDVARLGVGLSGPLTLDATVDRNTADGPWQTQADLTGPGGATVALNGTVAQDANTADLRLTGRAPLGLSNTLTNAALTQGTASYDLSLNGPLALSSVSGTVQIASGSRVIVSAANMALTVDRGIVTLGNEAAQLDFALGADAGGGLTASGRVGLTGNIPADLNIALNNLAVVDPTLYQTSVNGNVAVNGGLTGGANITGALTLGETNVSVSPSALGSGGDIPEITHINTPAKVTRTRNRAGLIVKDSGNGSGTSMAYGLDLSVDAPGKIYIRGRGLDTELGGSLRVRGTTQNVIPVGQFSLIRGRLSILGKRIVMTEGTLTLQGELDPVMRLVAETSNDELTVQIITEGRVSEPELTLSSSPQLPQEEILAQLLFGRGLSEVSALQAAQMAAAVATLTGKNDGLAASIRNSFGLDDIDLQTSETGTSSLKVGKYLSEKIYTDVTINNEGQSVINLNLDATPSVTVKGSASSDGETGLGVFFERDY
nr:translocation/assembly module TamB domain-containing protein [uncultured Celeribacter sp.]